MNFMPQDKGARRAFSWAPDGYLNRADARSPCTSDCTDKVKEPASDDDAAPHDLDIRLEERSRIGRELHDSMAQLIVALQIRLISLKDSLPGPPQDTVFRDLESTLDELHQQVRNATRPEANAGHVEGQLPSALKAMAGKFGQLTKLPIRVCLRGHCNGLPSKIERAIYRIAQEALANVQRHAHAQAARLVLILSASKVRLVVEDDGVGFDGLADTRGGVGLNNIRRRVEECGG